MPSVTDIANLALQHLGTERISDIGEEYETARVCALNYPQARDEVLETSQWSCAKKQTVLSRLTEDPLFNWKAAYQLPSDFIRLCSIGRRWAWFPNEYFDRQGSKLLLNGNWWNDCEPSDTLEIEYIFRQEDTSSYSPLLVDSIALLLAAKMARRLTGSDSKAQTLLEQYERVTLPRSRTLNAQQLYSGKNHPIQRQILRRGGDLSHVGYDYP